MTAGIDIKMAAQIFGKSKEFKLFDWSDAWELASTYKIWYQPSLEARYQDQCSAELGAMTNHQPQPVTGSATSPLPGGFMSGYVDCYPETPLTSVYEGNAGSTQDFIDWCKEDMKENVENPVPPKPSDIGDSLTDLVNWGEEIGLELWSKNQLCIDGQPWEEWTQNVGGSIDNLNCEYRDPETGQAHSWLCRDALKAVVKTWGCLEANLSPASVAMAMTFPHLRPARSLHRRRRKRAAMLDFHRLGRARPLRRLLPKRRHLHRRKQPGGVHSRHGIPRRLIV